MMDKRDANQKPTKTDWQAALDAERARIATTALPVMIGAAVVVSVSFIGIYFMLGRPWQWVGMVFELTQATVLLTLAYILARRGHLAATVYLAVLAINLNAIIGPALVEGMAVPGVLAGVISIMFARLLAGRAENRIVMLISGAAMVAGIALSRFQVFEILPLSTWVQAITTVIAVIMVVFLTALILDSRDERYEDSLAQAETYATELDAQRAMLEEHTFELERRTRYLEATAEVARDAASVLDLGELLSRVVTLVSEQFGFYHTGVFLLDPDGEWAVLQAASSRGGQRMLARGHGLRVGQEGIVGYVTGRGEPRIALDVGADAVFFDNPDLPDTRSEMALPLRARGEIIGALDVQSREPEAFSQEDVAVLQTLADQVATAISNARLFHQAQESLEAERQAYVELGREAWRELLRTRPGLGYRYDEGSVVLLNGHSPASHPVWGTLHPIRGTSHPDADAKLVENLPELALPIRVRGHVIGRITAHKPGDADEWTAEEMALMETLTEQLSVALESARLHQDTQRRATRERLTGQVTARMRESLDLETVLKTAADEMYQALGLDEIVIRLAIGEENGPHAGG
jgi:GAF domain-containing protein